MEDKMDWKVLESTYLHQEPWLTIRKDTCEMPNGVIVPAFYINEYPEWVNIFGLTKKGKVILVKQYRHGVKRVGIELPGGVAEKGETMEEAVKREALEETGYAFKQVQYLGKVSANPSTTNNFTHMFLGTGGEKIAEQNLDETEDVTVQLYSIEEVKNLLVQNEIVQSLHVSSIFYALLKLGEIKL
ncbi:MAG: NUDIX hydrolase [Chitinophagaceae bacterium]